MSAMMMPRTLLHSAIWALLALGASGPALADSTMVSGSKLIFTDSLSDKAIIKTDPTLSGQIRIVMEDHLDCLSVSSQGGAALISTTGCESDPGEVQIFVPPQAPLVISLTSDGDLQADDTLSPVVATLTGSGDMHLGRTGSLIVTIHGSGNLSTGAVEGAAMLEMTGSGDVHIGSLRGPLTVKRTGSGDVAIGAINADSATIESTGSGDFLAGAGTIGYLSAHLRGNGDLLMAATIGNGDVTASGGGDVKLGHVTGTLHKESSGHSSIYTGGPAFFNGLLADITAKIGEDSSDTHHHQSTTVTVSHGTHIFTLIFVVLVVYIGWRMVRRRGGVASLRSAFAVPTPSSAPSNPGVQSVLESLTRLDQRLSRVETYVTSREFDLQQKFRNL